MFQLALEQGVDMRVGTFLNRLALGIVLCFVLQAGACYYGNLDYDVPRPGGGADSVHVQVVVEEEPGKDFVTHTSYNITVNGRRLERNSAEYNRYLSMLYIPSITVRTSSASKSWQTYPKGDPTAIRPRGSIDPPIPDTSLGIRPKS
ncbi:MAG: hypothetical protein ACRECO_07975 [Xanthobacteraceae bacterium]